MSRSVCSIVVVIALLLASPAFAQPPEFSAVTEAANDVIASGDIPGAVILVGRGDEILYHRAFGMRSLIPDAEPMTTDTIFDIASLTKPVGTTLAIMSLVEKGAIKLDAPLGRYLREFRPSAYNEITIRRMLTHSAGFPPTPPNGAVALGFPRAARALAKVKLGYAPGTNFDYSDMGFILLGEVVRRVSGDPLDQYLGRVLFRPLRLNDTGFRPPARLHDRIAPTQWHNGHMMRGEVHDPRARSLGGVAGHAGIFSTSSDLATICRMLVDGGIVDGRRVLRRETVELMWTRDPSGNGKRALGWDVISGYAHVMAPFFPAGSVGHTGFTGTSIWIDPPTRTYLIILTNRVHPDGGGANRIRELRTRVAAAVGAALFRPPVALVTNGREPAADAPEVANEGERVPRGAPRPVVRTGLDMLVEQDFAPLRGHRVGLVTNQTGVDAQGRRAIDLIAEAPGVKLQAIFSPEHGITGTVDANVPNSRDAATGRPIWSLYGATRRPDADMLQDVTAIVYDIQDVGARYYTYLSTLVYVLETAGHRGIPVVVLDRPNPITGRVVEGPLLDPDLESFTGIHPIPVRTGLTVGEFARLVVAERELPVSLTVIAMNGWERARWYDDTGLPWVNPSPNIRSLTEALLYSGIGLLEATNLSVGRGTPTPFEVVGAPWIDALALRDALERRNLPGVRFEPVWFTPSADTYAHVGCAGVRMVVTDRDTIRPVTIALAIASELRERHRAGFRPEGIQNLLVNRATMWSILRGEPLESLLAWADADRASFLKRRASYLIYR